MVEKKWSYNRSKPLSGAEVWGSFGRSMDSGTNLALMMAMTRGMGLMGGMMAGGKAANQAPQDQPLGGNQLLSPQRRGRR